MAAPLHRLLAAESVALVEARYFRFMDEQDWSNLRELFVDDLDFHHPTIGTYNTADEAVAAISARVAGVSTVHHGHNAEITVSSERDDIAEGRWALQSFVFVPGSDAPGITRYASYHDHLRRIAGAWRFTAIHFTYRHDPAAPR